MGEDKTVVAGLDALTGAETYREELDVKVTSAVPLDVKDGQERTVIMLVDRWVCWFHAALGVWKDVRGER